MTTDALGLAAPFSLTGGSCATSVTLAASGGNCTLIVTFAPTVAGTFGDSIDLSYNDGASTKTASRAITGAGQAISVSLSPATPWRMKIGTTQQFTATVTGTNDTLVTWDTVEPSGCGSFDNASPGLYLAPSSPATCHVRATSHADSSKSATVDVYVQNNVMVWEALKVGAGGWLTGLDIAKDTDNPNKSVIAVRCDTYGGYVGDGVAPWRQVLSSATMPASDLAGWRIGKPGAPSTNTPWLATGIYDIRIAPSSTNILFAIIGGSDTTAVMYRSTDRGQTWRRAGPAPGTSGGFNAGQVSPGGGDPERLTGQHIAIDPINSNVVYAGGRERFYVSFNAAVEDADTVTWSEVLNGGAPLHSPSEQGGWGGIVFDRTGSTTAGRTNTVYVMSNGYGLYRGTWDGTATTWQDLSNSGPKQGYGGYIDHKGTYWTAPPHAGPTVWWLKSGQSNWESRNLPVGEVKGVLVDPGDANANRILVFDEAGDIALSINGGDDWEKGSHSRDADGDIPWHTVPVHSSMAYGGQTFAWDPVNAGKIWASDGIGVWWFNAPTNGSDNVVHHAKSIGIEQLVTYDIALPPNSQYVYVGTADRSTFRIPRANSAYPSTYASIQMNVWSDLVNTGGVDYSRIDPKYLAVIQWNPLNGKGASGYTENGGDTWTLFPDEPTTGINGNIAVPSIDNIIVIDGYNGTALRSVNKGVSWDAPMNGLPVMSSTAMYLPTRRIAIDGGYNGGTNRIIYIYDPGSGLYRSKDDGASWTRISTKTFNGGNLCKLRAVPGRQGHLFLTKSYTGSSGSDHPDPWNDALLYYATDADTADSLNWIAVTGFDNPLAGDGEPSDFAFGAEATAGQGYPTIYVAGYRNFAWGIYQTASFDPGANTAQWDQLSDWPMTWSNGTAGNLDNVYTMGASMDTYGEVYVGFQGSGWAKGTMK